MLLPATGWTVNLDAEGQCLALAVYWEAKNEGREDMEAVGWVVLNREAHDEFPDSICAVVRDGGETPPCQFSWWCDGKSDRPTEADNWSEAQAVASDLIEDPGSDPTGGALFFHSTAIDMPWRIPRTRTAQIGGHVYYR
jgi:spore germination cell wall hydrolase CwlJ-like protein